MFLPAMNRLLLSIGFSIPVDEQDDENDPVHIFTGFFLSSFPLFFVISDRLEIQRWMQRKEIKMNYILVLAGFELSVRLAALRSCGPAAQFCLIHSDRVHCKKSKVSHLNAGGLGFYEDDDDFVTPSLAVLARLQQYHVWNVPDYERIAGEAVRFPRVNFTDPELCVLFV
nr:uncharacterized protein LOC109166665 [Ipomoea batatas]